MIVGQNDSDGLKASKYEEFWPSAVSRGRFTQRTRRKGRIYTTEYTELHRGKGDFRIKTLGYSVVIFFFFFTLT